MPPCETHRHIKYLACRNRRIRARVPPVLLFRLPAPCPFSRAGDGFGCCFSSMEKNGDVSKYFILPEFCQRGKTPRVRSSDKPLRTAAFRKNEILRNITVFFHGTETTSKAVPGPGERARRRQAEQKDGRDPGTDTSVSPLPSPFGGKYRFGAFSHNQLGRKREGTHRAFFSPDSFHQQLHSLFPLFLRKLADCGKRRP